MRFSRTAMLRLAAVGFFVVLSNPLAAQNRAADESLPVEPMNIEPRVWITLGHDAYLDVSELAVQAFGYPLFQEARQGDVVATRLATSDIPRLTEMLHDRWMRCPGFMAHADHADALRALEAATAPAATEGTSGFIIDQAPLVGDLISRLDQTRILQTIEHLSTQFPNRYWQHPSGVASATWIRDQWQSFAAGRPDVTVEFYEHPGWAQPSVILTIEGVGLPNEVVVLGGHQDSIAPGSSNPNFSAPGADDNASGIATLTEVIRVAMGASYRPARSVQFMAYAAEEVGLLGSQEIAGAYAAANVDVVAVLQLDMTAYHGSVQDVGFLSDFTNAPLTSFAKDVLDTYQPEIQWVDTACGYACSDHAAWHLEGYPAVMSAESIVGQHNPTIHSTSDVTGTFGGTADHSIKFARLATALMAEIAGNAADVEVFADGFESGNTSAWSALVN